MEIGYCIGREYWHKGFVSEALAAVMQYLLTQVGAERIEARHDPRNPHSGAVMRKCGMKYEGTRIRADWNNSGVCDCALYGYVRAADGKDPEEEHGAGQPVRQSAADKRHTSCQKKNVISDETIAYVSVLAGLKLSEEEKAQAGKDMGDMLDYIDRLNELDTQDVEPMSHIFPVKNVFREDVVENGDGSADTLFNAPEKKDGGFKVPKTIG